MMPDERAADYYSLLELRQTATDVEIKKAWHEQLQVWHPDRFTHAPALYRKAEARTKLLNQAYQTLSDPTARARYNATVKPSPSPTHGATTSPPASTYATTPPRQQAPRPHETRGPQSLIMLSQRDKPKVMVPAIHLYVDPHEQFPYRFDGFVRIAGVIRETLPAGGYAIAEAPELLCIKRISVEELYRVFSNPSDNRAPFLSELEHVLPFPSRFLVVEGTLQHRKAGGRLNQYHKIGLMDFLDAITARYGLHVMYADSRDEAEERIANLAALHYAYYFAEQQGLDRCLSDNDV